MNKFILSLLFTVSAPALIACADAAKPPQPIVSAPAPNVPNVPVVRERETKTVEITINGETPEVYYSFFLFHHTPVCSSPWYQYAGTFSFDMRDDSLGQKVRGDLALLMLPNGTYYGAYEEATLGKRTEFGYPVLKKEKRQIKGRWKIQGPDIVFENLGKGFAMLVNKRRTIQLRVEPDLISPGLSGRVVEIDIMNSNYIKVPELDRCAR